MKTIAPECNVWLASDVLADLSDVLNGRDPRQTFVLVDEGSRKFCLDIVAACPGLPHDHIIEIPAGDDAKDYSSALKIWEFLSNHGATRKALLVNLGGGMPCDLGGFCAATFKRGIEFINIPTTLLSQVDASLGGKTGMNLGSLKNEIGVFGMASHVLISGVFLKTMDKENLLSGFAEMIKHAFIHKADAVDKLLNFDFDNVNFDLLEEYVAESIQIKNFFVLADPKEKGIRKALNFGHTVGHAFETYCMRAGTPILHGRAVGYGLVCEILMSRDKMGLDASVANDLARRVMALYGPMPSLNGKVDELIELMRHDKKNGADGINFTLLPKVGDVVVNQIGTPAEIEKVLKEFAQLNV